jgi:hypothetical protein
VAHAQQQNGIGGAGTTPFGDIGVVDHDFSTGYRAGGGFGLDACSDITFTYADFSTSGSNQLDPPTIPGGGGSIGSLVHHPGAAITASAGPVSAFQSTGFQTADVLYRRVLYRKCSGGLNYLLGAQYGTLDQDFSQTGVFSGGAGGVVNTGTSISFDGAGLKAGLDGEQLMWRRISIYGRLTAAVMSGQFQSNYTMQNSTTGVLLAQSNWSENRVVPQVDYELGLQWTSPNNHWRARAGYLVSHWSNAVTSPTFIDAVQANNYTNVEDTITFDGAVGRIEFIW